jgi:hypothetical protein
MLGRPRPARQLGAYLIGGMGLSIIFGLVIVLALHGSTLRLGKSTKGIIEVVVGSVLIVVAIAVLSGRALHWHPRPARNRDGDHPQRQSLHSRALGNDSLWIAWAAGAVYSFPGVYYVAGPALLVKLNASAITNVLAVFGFNLIMFALIELPLIGLVVMPNRARTPTEQFNVWMTAHRRVLIVIVAGAIGTYLLASGLSDLS